MKPHSRFVHQQGWSSTDLQRQPSTQPRRWSGSTNSGLAYLSWTTFATDVQKLFPGIHLQKRKTLRTFLRTLSQSRLACIPPSSLLSSLPLSFSVAQLVVGIFSILFPESCFAVVLLSSLMKHTFLCFEKSWLDIQVLWWQRFSATHLFSLFSHPLLHLRPPSPPSPPSPPPPSRLVEELISRCGHSSY